MDVAKWLLSLGDQAGCLGENEREIHTTCPRDVLEGNLYAIRGDAQTSSA
jgi:hypothetical protein